MLRTSGPQHMLRRTARLLLHERMMDDVYTQESFEALRRFRESPTYPGAIRAATPGDTRHYMSSQETVLPAGDRHYWRPVTDDPRVEHVVPFRVRFKDNVWVTTGWELRMHVVQVMLEPSATVQQLIDEVVADNQSPYLCLKPFTIAVNGKALNPTDHLDACGVNEFSQIDAIDVDDHRAHEPDFRPKDWNVDELTDADMKSSPYRELGTPLKNNAPRWSAIPSGKHNFGKI